MQEKNPNLLSLLVRRINDTKRGAVIYSGQFACTTGREIFTQTNSKGTRHPACIAMVKDVGALRNKLGPMFTCPREIKG